MDPDISDILASVTRAYPAANAHTSIDTSQEKDDQQILTKAWISERLAPELLPYPTDLMARIMARIRQQRKIETVEDHTARMDAGTSFALVVMQTELERVKFLLRSFLRARIAKIDAHSLHILAQHHSRSQDGSQSAPLLSPQEVQYLTTHAALLERHYSASFLTSFPTKLRRLDDKAGAGGSGMVEGPDLEKAVFVRCLGDSSTSSAPAGYTSSHDLDEDTSMGEDILDRHYGVVEISCGFSRPTRDSDPHGDIHDPSQTQSSLQEGERRTVEMKRGEIWIARWSSVRQAVQNGLCELI